MYCSSEGKQRIFICELRTGSRQLSKKKVSSTQDHITSVSCQHIKLSSAFERGGASSNSRSREGQDPSKTLFQQLSKFSFTTQKGSRTGPPVYAWHATSFKHGTRGIFVHPEQNLGRLVSASITKNGYCNRDGPCKEAPRLNFVFTDTQSACMPFVTCQLSRWDSG